MYYELHPQVWGNDIAGEAFAEVLRFAVEELGCTSVSVCVLHKPKISPVTRIGVCLFSPVRLG